MSKVPFVFLNVATTVDGKLAPASRKFVPFASRRDQKLLLELRATADAVMAGARTVDLMPVSLGPGGARYRALRRVRGLADYNLRVIVSGAGTLDPGAAIFQKRFSPIIVLTSGSVPARRLQALSRVADQVKAFGGRELDLRSALEWLRKEWGVKRLLCEGGGEINAGLFRAGLVREVYQTVCPLVFGGRNAPTLADGGGVELVRQAAKLRLKSIKRHGSELFLAYRVLCGFRSGAQS